MNFSELVAPNGLFSDGDWIEKKDQDENGRVRLIQLADIGVCLFKDKSAKFVTEAKAQALNCTFLQKGDILVARLPDPLGRACIFPLDGKYITAVDVAIIRITRQDISPKYIMYLINSPSFRAEIKKFESGTTRKRISRKNLDKIQFDIPPFPVQERIVSRIEELFSQLNASVSELKTAKERLKVYRQAVLKEVFSKYHTFDSLLHVSERIFDGPFGSNLKTADYVEQGIRVVRLENLKNAWFDDTKRSFVTKEKYQTISTHTIYPDDLIMSTFISENIKICQLPKEVGFAVNKADCVGIRLKNDINPRFVMFYLASQEAYNALIHQVHGATRPRVNTKQIKAMQIPVVELKEQDATVAEIEEKMSICDNIEKTVDIALRQVEALRQSILKKAFEGGLQ